MKPHSTIRIFFLCFAALISNSTLVAEELPTPSGKVLLVVNGNIKNHNSEESVQFDMEMLEKLDPVSLVTSTPWTDGKTEFTGVRVNDILKYVGAGSNQFRAKALDKYYFDVSDIDFDKIPAIIAYKKNGELMSVRELGPLWMIFPFDEYPELNNEKHKNASVWQLIELIVK